MEASFYPNSPLFFIPNMSRQNPKCLDPFNHSSAVRRFFEFYQITRKPPSLPVLGEILTHFSGLPFENISKIIKLRQDYTSPERLRLPEEVMEDHAFFHLGGTCFALTYFLQAILCECGFLCYPFIAHIGRTPNLHCALIVLFNNRKYLVDPGYLLNLPMELHKDVSRVYRTEHTGVELAFEPQDEHFNLSTFDGTEKKRRYTFFDQPLALEEFLKFWLDSFYWPIMRGITLTRVTADGMVYINNQFVQVQNLTGKRKGVVTDIHLLVKEAFGIAPEWVERAQEAIPEIVAWGQQFGYYRKK
jgi:arylamine N-acetyltransferase